VTANVTPLLAWPFTVTTAFPVVAPVGTMTVMLVADHAGYEVASVPPNLTILVPLLAPKFAPVIVTVPPTGPLLELSELIVGAVVTVKGLALLATPPTVTITLPVAAPVGTVAVMPVLVQPVMVVAGVPLKVTVLDP
jgi:hypothetical protein